MQDCLRRHQGYARDRPNVLGRSRPTDTIGRRTTDDRRHPARLAQLCEPSWQGYRKGVSGCATREG